jgi:hypothetical protein
VDPFLWFIGVLTFVTVLCALPWFIFEKRRPGLVLPPGASLLTVGFKQTYVAFRECMKLKQTFLYLIFYFLMYVRLAFTWGGANFCLGATY